MTAAGIDTWSPSWYLHPDGPAAAWMREHATVPGKLGDYLPEKIAGHRVGWFRSGLVFAEGHPDTIPLPGHLVAEQPELCPPDELVVRTLALQEELLQAGLPLPTRGRPFDWMGAESEGFAGVRRLDATVNLGMASGAVGLAYLAGIMACARDAPGVAQGVWGASRALETVYLRGRAGKAVLGRWYDKAVEAALGPRGTLIRGEDQRRWPKGSRRCPSELTAEYVKSQWQRRFYPLWKASKGVTVAGPVVIAGKLQEAVQAGEITAQKARLLAGDVLFDLAQAHNVAKPSTLRRSRADRRELGLVLADGVLEEVEVDISTVLEAALETDAWQRRG